MSKYETVGTRSGAAADTRGHCGRGPRSADRGSHRCPEGGSAVYTGTDGVELAGQPLSHQWNWTDQQWLAFEEHQRLETELSRDKKPVAAVSVVKPHDSASTDSP